MSTRNVVPRADEEGSLGTALKRWLSACFSHQVQIGTSFIRWTDSIGLEWSNDGTTWTSFENSPDGDVVGPSSVVDNAVALFDSTTGKLIKESSVTIVDGDIVLEGTVDGRDLSADGEVLDALAASAITGPATSTATAIAVYSGTDGLVLANTSTTVDASGNIGVPALATVDGRDVSVDGSALDTLVNTTVPSKVTGASSSVDNTVPRFDSTTGKVIQNSGVTIDDSNNIKTGGALLAGSTGSMVAGAVLQADSTSKGFLPPRVTTSQKNAIAVTGADGLFVFDTDLNAHCGYNGSSWVTYGTTGTASTETMAKLFQVENPIAEDPDYVYASLASSSGNTPSGPFTSPDVPRALSVYFPTDWDGGNITVTGTDAIGNAVAETFIADPNNTVLGDKAFDTVSTVTKVTVGTGSSNASIGIRDVFGVNANIIDSFGMGVSHSTYPVAFIPTIDVTNNTFAAGIPSNGITSFVVTLNIAHTHTIS